jgi:hypothetical protein
VAGQPETSVTDPAAADGPLVARAAAGDAGAFRVLVERHERRIVALLHRLCGCPEQALDLAQETVLSAHRHLGSFRHESRFSPSITPAPPAGGGGRAPRCRWSRPTAAR